MGRSRRFEHHEVPDAGIRGRGGERVGGRVGERGVYDEPHGDGSDQRADVHVPPDGGERRGGEFVQDGEWEAEVAAWSADGFDGDGGGPPGGVGVGGGDGQLAGDQPLPAPAEHGRGEDLVAELDELDEPFQQRWSGGSEQRRGVHVPGKRGERRRCGGRVGVGERDAAGAA